MAPDLPVPLASLHCRESEHEGNSLVPVPDPVTIPEPPPRAILTPPLEPAQVRSPLVPCEALQWCEQSVPFYMYLLRSLKKVPSPAVIFLVLASSR